MTLITDNQRGFARFRGLKSQSYPACAPSDDRRSSPRECRGPQAILASASIIARATAVTKS
jgi:hypothetical protein